MGGPGGADERWPFGTAVLWEAEVELSSRERWQESLPCGGSRWKLGRVPRVGPAWPHSAVPEVVLWAEEGVGRMLGSSEAGQ